MCPSPRPDRHAYSPKEMHEHAHVHACAHAHTRRLVLRREHARARAHTHTQTHIQIDLFLLSLGFSGKKNPPGSSFSVCLTKLIGNVHSSVSEVMVFLLFHTCPVKFMDPEEGGGPGGTGFTSMGPGDLPRGGAGRGRQGVIASLGVGGWGGESVLPTPRPSLKLSTEHCVSEHKAGESDFHPPRGGKGRLRHPGPRLVFQAAPGETGRANRAGGSRHPVTLGL